MMKLHKCLYEFLGLNVINEVYYWQKFFRKYKLETKLSMAMRNKSRQFGSNIIINLQIKITLHKID